MPNPSVLYHYCSNSAFHSIISQKKVRLSLLSMSNDSKEGRHVLDLARKLLPDTFAYKSKALDELQRVTSLLSAIGFCVSADGDVLSQWRAYADDARGVAIGFDRDGLDGIAEAEGDKNIKVALGPVAYGEAFLEELIQEDLKPIVEHYESGRMKRPSARTILSDIGPEKAAEEKERFKQATSELFLMLYKIANYAYLVKAPFFMEEQEWRILALLPNLDGALALPNARLHAHPDRLTPFRDFPLNGFETSVVREIVLGPRNQTPVEVVRLFLEGLGFRGVTIRRSAGSYR